MSLGFMLVMSSGLVMLTACERTSDGSDSLVIVSPTDPGATPIPDLSPDPESSNASAPVEPFISIADITSDGLTVRVGGLVLGVAEDGGTCTFTLSPVYSGQPVSAVTSGIENVTTTSCGTTDIPVSSLARGSWEIILEYSSETVDAVSQTLILEIP